MQVTLHDAPDSVFIHSADADVSMNSTGGNVSHALGSQVAVPTHSPLTHVMVGFDAV